MKRQDYLDILPLTGVTVLEIGEHVSAPYCTKIMGNLGANVIKIEAPLKGDPSRLQGPFKDDSPHPERSGLFLFLNSGKKSITLNLEIKSGQALFFKLVDDVDVLVENSNLNYLKDQRIEYELLQKRNPKLVMTSITTFNQKSSYNDRPASDINAIAISGIQSTLGDPLREPLNLPYSLCEFQAGAHAAAATLMALFSSKMTGVGQIIHISVADALIGAGSAR